MKSMSNKGFYLLVLQMKSISNECFYLLVCEVKVCPMNVFIY